MELEHIFKCRNYNSIPFDKCRTCTGRAINCCDYLPSNRRENHNPILLHQLKGMPRNYRDWIRLSNSQAHDIGIRNNG